MITGRTRPREVFQSPEETIMRRYSAQERGEILGVVDAYMSVGLSREEAVKRAIAERERSRGIGGSAYQSVAGRMPDGTEKMGVFDRAQGVYIDPITRQPLTGFQPRQTTGSTSLGADRESLARELFGKRAADLSTEQMAKVNDRLLTFSGERAGSVTSGRMEAGAAGPLNVQQRFQATTTLTEQWKSATADRDKMKQQLSLMKTGIDRYDADPIGSSQAVLVTFQKILDPPSVVRESEYARSPAGLSAKDWLYGLIEKYQKGGVGVPKPILIEMAKTAEAFTTDENMKSALNNVRQRIHDTATSYEIDPRLVLGSDMPTATAAPTTGPVPAIVGTPPGAAAGVRTTAPAAPPTAPGKSQLDATVPRYFVDANGNLIKR
jgi:hypothetical protein